jgi:hypothetical protein
VWGAFPLTYVHCVLKRTVLLNQKKLVKDYLLLPSGWVVHNVEGDKAKIGTYNPVEKTLTSPNGVVEDWSTSRLVGNRQEETKDVSGLEGVSDVLEEQLIEEAKALQPEEQDSTAIQAVADDADQNAAVVCHAVAMYDFDGSNSGGRNISFKAGSIIEVTEMVWKTNTLWEDLFFTCSDLF